MPFLPLVQIPSLRALFSQELGGEMYVLCLPCPTFGFKRICMNVSQLFCLILRTDVNQVLHCFVFNSNQTNFKRHECSIWAVVSFLYCRRQIVGNRSPKNGWNILCHLSGWYSNGRDSEARRYAAISSSDVIPLRSFI